MNYIPPIPPEMMNRYADGSPSQQPQRFPKNLAASITPEVSQKMLMWLMSNYIWPQVQERVPFERMWDKMLEMVRITLPYDELFDNTRHDASKAKNTADQSSSAKNRVSDSCVHDAVQRLTDITYFIAFKEGLPCQFAIPDYIKQQMSTPEYRPLKDRIAAGNALLQWNSGNMDVKRNSLIAYRHHYTYGCAFVMSDFQFRVEMITRQNNSGAMVSTPEITKVGTSFEPISLRKLWFNWRLPVYDMDQQPCPFFFEETPRFAVLQNVYHETMNPFGYVNLDKAMQNQYIYSEPEMASVQQALRTTFSMMGQDTVSDASLAQILQPKYSVEAKWTLFPVMPFDPVTGEFEKRADGTLIPFARFVMETFGPNLHSGRQLILRLQENYYPKRHLPLYASCHMPDLDSGAYAPSLGQILYNHWKEICLCMEQYLDNKDWINNAPAWVQVSSPAANVDLNAPGAKIKVNGPNDFGWKSPLDATSSTVAMLQLLRDQAQTTGKVVDAVLGKAMGSRTSATEAQNAFQASMSSITSDIDAISSDLHGNYAHRVWDYSGSWMDADLLQNITGQFGFAISPEDMWMNVGVITNVGSTYVEKIVKQQNIRYVLESSRGEPNIDRSALWIQLLDEMGFDGASVISDGGREQQIQLANQQACQTYLGQLVLVDPDQDHQIAISTKSSYIKDRLSIWNTTQEYAANAPLLIQQIQQHQFMLQLQQQAELIQQQMAVAQAQLKVHQENPLQLQQQQQPGIRNAGPPAQQAGQIAQQGASAA